MTDFANAETVRAIVEPTAKAAASAAIRDFVSQHPHFAPPPKAEIPAPLKWAGIIAAAVMTLSVTGMAAWMVTTLNELQLTVREISTRLQTDTTVKRLDAVEEANAKQAERITALEQGKVRR
jgi:hypothetical protein